jgi:hypothetical protein
MTTTQELIRQLVGDAHPVRRLRPPLLRAGIWIAVAVSLLAVVAAALGVRPDLALKLGETAFVIEVVSAGLTGVLAAVAAFHLSLPDRSARWILLPIPTLLLWLSTVGYGCLTNWVGPGPSSLAASISVKCLETIALGSTPLAALLFFMLRHARFVRATVTASVAAIAVAGLTVSALRTFHELDVTVMVLIWNVGAAAAITLIGTLFGRRMFGSPVAPPLGSDQM